MSNVLFIGLMSGTSLDGADAAIVEFADPATSEHEDAGLYCKVVATHSLPFSTELRTELLDLHSNGSNELERSALAGNTLARLYANTVNALLAAANIDKSQVTAIGCHGQTIRHRPELGYTLQIGNASLLTELTGIPVIADFRSRDIAAGGQGAPLVPAFHHAAFGNSAVNRVLVNIGGIANLSYLPARGEIIGFDSGPGNMLMDAWIELNLGKQYDASGAWAASGSIIPDLLDNLLTEPFLKLPPPKSTGRDLFNMDWLRQYLEKDYVAADVQRTLLQFTAITITDAIKQYCRDTAGQLPDEVYLCGGGAYNSALMQCLQSSLEAIPVRLTDDLGISVGWVEAAAFAWLARQSWHKQPGNMPGVTGAKGPRILGAIYAY